ncbi:MAG: hypothetical protein R3D59_10390 [Paracoccaceae bacterium]
MATSITSVSTALPLSKVSDLVMRGPADLLAALARLLAFGLDQPGPLERVHMRRGRGLRQTEALGDLVDVERSAFMQHGQDRQPRRRPQTFQDRAAVFGGDRQEPFVVATSWGHDFISGGGAKHNTNPDY